MQANSQIGEEESSTKRTGRSLVASLDAGDEHVDVAGADVLAVEFVAGFLDEVLRLEENETCAGLPAKSLLQMDVLLFNLDVPEELDHLGLGDVARHASELDALRQVVLVQDPLKVDADAAELIVHE